MNMVLGRLLVTIPIFVLVLACALEALRHSGMFCGSAPRAVVAACVAVLSVLSLLGTWKKPAATAAGGQTDGAEVGGMIDFLLIPYAALAIAVLIGALVLLWLRIRAGAEGAREPAEDRRRTRKPTRRRSERREGLIVRGEPNGNGLSPRGPGHDRESRKPVDREARKRKPRR